MLCCFRCFQVSHTVSLHWQSRVSYTTALKWTFLNDDNCFEMPIITLNSCHISTFKKYDKLKYDIIHYSKRKTTVHVFINEEVILTFQYHLCEKLSRFYIIHCNYKKATDLWYNSLLEKKTYSIVTIYEEVLTFQYHLYKALAMFYIITTKRQPIHTAPWVEAIPSVNHSVTLTIYVTDIPLTFLKMAAISVVVLLIPMFHLVRRATLQVKVL